MFQRLLLGIFHKFMKAMFVTKVERLVIALVTPMLSPHRHATNRISCHVLFPLISSEPFVASELAR